MHLRQFINKFVRLAAMAFLLVGALLLQACSQEPTDSTKDPNPNPNLNPSPSNLLINPGFEAPLTGEWYDFSKKNPNAWSTFQIDDRQALTGQHSLLLALDSQVHAFSTQILGAAQNVHTAFMPDLLAGSYHVEDWKRGAKRQYLQVVIVVWGTQKVPKGIEVSNYQIAYILEGIQEPPLRILNRHFLFPRGSETPIEPKLGEWKRFKLPVRQDFINSWGIDPTEFEYIRVFFEVRYDKRSVNDPRAIATVRYDDLYFGPTL